MPHKKNTIGYERRCGLEKEIRGNTKGSKETIELWQERDKEKY